MALLLRLFIEFFKIGIVTFGGGQAMLPLLQHSFVTELHWITQERFLYFVSVAEVTPGPVALNMATFIGYELSGVIGSAFATLGVVMPSFLVILSVAHFEKKFKENVIYKRFMLGVKPVIIALLINAIYLIVSRGFVGFIPYIMAIVSLAVFILYKKSPVLILLIAGVIGVFVLR
ncbi:chromate transporter [Caldisericum sp. AR60]|uniref:chromate transporter n=1 Tax=Caldisericum sp. AR60 TaxID=3397852 RepID=UPI0039FD9398